ncbi:vesicular glutamate transporter 2-like [Culicoides brevitarsis]|uniref:vesicular glutamate transporter 2-like n=1 Tax=Culicoides brevitarsis TaxID=469753 RepID=UPI00307BBA0D
MTTLTNDDEVDPNWWKVWRNRRYVVSIMAFFGMLNMYSCRVNLSVAIVAMTQNSTEPSETTFEWTSGEKGLILSAFYYGYMPLQVFVGVILRRISAHHVFGIGIVVPGVITILTPFFAHNLAILVASRIVMGLFQCVAVPCLMMFWTVWAPPLERSRLHAISVSGGFVGTVFALPLSGVLGENFGWESIFYVIGGICVAWYGLWLILIRANPEKDRFATEFERNYIKRTIGKQCDAALEAKKSIPWKEIFTSVPVYGLILANFGWGWGYVTMLTQLPQFLSDMMNFDLGKNGFLSALPYLTMALMSLLAGYLADFFLIRKILTLNQVRKYYITFSMIIQAGFIITAAYVLNPYANIICISLTIGFGAMTYSGLGINYIDIAPAFAAVVAGIGNTLGTVPGIVSPLLTGAIVTSDKSDFEALQNEWRIVFFITAAAYLGGAVIYWFFGTAETQDWGAFEKCETKNEEKSDKKV